METRHPAGGSFGSEFSASVIVAELWRPEVARPGNLLDNFCVFFGNPVSKVYIDVDRRCCVQMS